MKQHFETLTDKGNRQDHFIFLPPVPLDFCKCVLPTHAAQDNLYDVHFLAYESYLNIPQWREIIWATTTAPDALDLQNVALVYTTSYEAQAIRQGFKTNIKPFGLAAFVHTRDNFLVFGTRTGAAMGGYLCNAPAGHCAPSQHGQNPLEAGFIEELKEELGLESKDLTFTRILGYQTDPDFGGGINNVLYAKTTRTFDDLLELHQQSRQKFMAAQNQGMSYNEAKAHVASQGVINIDAFEHEHLVPVPADRDVIQKIVESRQFQFNAIAAEHPTTAPVMDIARGAFLMLLKAWDALKL